MESTQFPNPASGAAASPDSRYADTAPDPRNLHQQYHEHFQPVGPGEVYLVNALADCDRRRRELAAAETELLEILTHKAGGPLPLGTAYHADLGGPKMLPEIFREIAATDRTYFSALTRLERLQQRRNADARQPRKPAAAPETSTPGPDPAVPTAPAATAHQPEPTDVPVTAKFERQPSFFTPPDAKPPELNFTRNCIRPELPPYATRIDKT